MTFGVACVTAWLLLLPAQDAEGEARAPAGGGAAEGLVRAIRDNLQRIDELLLETADADEPGGGIEQLVGKHREVIRDLEELIKQARYRPSGEGQGGGGQSGGPPSGQPPPREADGQRQPGQGDPSQPEGGSQDDEQPGGPRPEDSQGQRPDGAGQDGGAARQDRAQGPPPDDPLAEFTREDVDGRWGLLPPKLQEQLMNLHVDDVPERYRDWLSAYIRSMHRLEQREAASGGGR